MSKSAKEMPTVIIPYPGLGEDLHCRDYFVYLRPETNGVLVESTLLKIIERNPSYKSCISIVYLANIPGDFILDRRIVENHYSYKLPFARKGKVLFTKSMQMAFTKHFSTSFESAEIMGAFDALARLGLSEEELHGLRVPVEDVLYINCQLIKKVEDIFIVNYDIPALLHKNNAGTDIAVMVFRSTLESEVFHKMIEEMANALRKIEVLREGEAVGRAFHFSKGPFEQVLDARDYLYDAIGNTISLDQTQFCHFLLQKDIDLGLIQKVLSNPIMEFRSPSGEIIERCIFSYTEDDTYNEAYEKYISKVAQLVL